MAGITFDWDADSWLDRLLGGEIGGETATVGGFEKGLEIKVSHCEA